CGSLSVFALDPLDKALVYQALQNPGAGSRRPDTTSGQTPRRCARREAGIRSVPLSLLFPTQPASLGLRGGPIMSVLGLILASGLLHGGQQRRLGIVGG